MPSNLGLRIGGLLWVVLAGTALPPRALSAQLRDSASQASDSARVATMGALQVRGRVDDLRGIAFSPSQGRVGRADLRLRPLVREGELLEAIPGMILTQHSGDGKSNQMFVRGFNLDHGTDFQTRIEGMPINLPTHGHGQGYTDLNVLIPELVDHLDYKLGPYHAEFGDFGSAGGATLHLARSLAAPLAQVDVGAWGMVRGLVGASRTAGRQTWLGAIEGKQYDGPWDVPQGLQKVSGVGRWTWRGERDELSVLGLTYSNDWTATDQVPERAIAAQRIGRFGSLDATLGGRATRHSLSASWNRRLSAGTIRAEAYAVRHGFALWSNFTYFLDDASRGDQIEQRDDRTITGGEFEYTRATSVANVPQLWRVGMQLRHDDADVALHRSAARTRQSTVRADAVGQTALGGYATLESRWHSALRTMVGARYDVQRFDVTSDLSVNSGARSAGLASPKASLVVGPFRGTEFYLAGGLGYHSNDARGTVISIDPASGEAADRVDPLVRSRGAEIGLRTLTAQNLHTTLSVWTLRLDSELLFVGDAGTTEPQGGSERVGVTFANFWRVTPRVSVDADIALARSRFSDVPADESRIPGAMEQVVAAGLTWEPVQRGPALAVRLRHFGSHALIEDNSVRGTPTTLVNAQLGWQVRRARVMLAALNLFDTQARDIQYFYGSRLSGEPIGGVEDVHFHPVEPRQLRLSVAFGR
jgi:hypothetical protein